MLFDERDLRVFDDPDSRNYFKEILQSYYSQNYRATVVLLYSFVIYDLFMKLKTMASEGDKKAKKKLVEINKMMVDSDEKYSKVENEVIRFFKDNCSLYFGKFIEDVEYLKNCRNKCAHLKVDNDTLYVPNDYNARMLICSMYDNVFSVKAPFIMDLFSIAKNEVEKYAESISRISLNNGLDDTIKKAITDKYLKRMTYDSFKKSYKTFIHLLFVADNEDCEKNIFGLYAFTFAMTDYLVNNHVVLFEENDIIGEFAKIKVDLLTDNKSRQASIISIMLKYSVIMDIIRENNDVFEYISEKVLTDPSGLHFYCYFYPRETKTIYEFFKEKNKVQQPGHSERLYDVLKNSDDFNLAEFTLILVKAIPAFNGYNIADSFMDFFKSHMEKLSIEEIKKVMEVYDKNKQCTGRARHTTDISEIKEYIEKQSEESNSKERADVEAE